MNSFIAARDQIVCQYNKLLEHIPGLTFYREPAWGRSVCWLYSFLVEPQAGLSRDQLIDTLKSHAIESKPFFPSIPGLPIYLDHQPYPVAEHLAHCGISLPTSPHLQPEKLSYIATTVQKAFKLLR